MYRFFICVLLSVVSAVWGERFSVEREGSASPIVYYFNESVASEYPILVLCDGAEVKGSLTSVLLLRNCFAPMMETLGVGYLTVEKWGIYGDHIYEQEFWNHYTRTQRLNDHVRVLKYLEAHPPRGWNGKLIFVGISEGGRIVTELSRLFPNTVGTINWSGAVDYPWAEEFWHLFQYWKKHSCWYWSYDAVPRWVPFSSDMPESRKKYDSLVQKIIRHPDPDRWLGGMTYLYHADAFQMPPIAYDKIRAPLLVVMGTKDPNIDSCDQFVRKAKEAGAPVTYLRIEKMDHDIRNRPDVIDQSFAWLREIIR